MNASQLKRYCRGFPDATQTLYGEPWNFLVYSIGGKKFAYFKTSQPERWRFSIRVTPDRFIELTDVPGVKPARYRGRYGWITIVDVSRFPVPYLEELVEWSYRWALSSLSRKRRTAIGQTDAGARAEDDAARRGPTGYTSPACGAEASSPSQRSLFSGPSSRLPRRRPTGPEGGSTTI